MPTYYSCGEREEWPADEERHMPFPCPTCQEESGDEEEDYDSDDDSGVNTSAAQRAVHAVRQLRDFELPIVHMPGIRRDMSCEWEAVDGVDTVRYALEMLGVAGASFEYHSDSTCDGEIVFARVPIRTREGAALYGRSLAVIRELHAAGVARVGYAAGHHIHVAARDVDGVGMSPNGLAALFVMFRHCEDLLYRLASAGWPRHRDEGSDGYRDQGWAKCLPDTDGAPSPRTVGMAISGDRYHGLNLTPYLSSIAACSCGAYRFGEWEACTCSDRGSTIEWRLFNAAVSPRKIRAYLAIVQGMTNHAADTGDAGNLNPNPYRGVGDVQTGSLARQLAYLLALPTLSDFDRESIAWLASISPGMGHLSYSEALASAGHVPAESV